MAIALVALLCAFVLLYGSLWIVARDSAVLMTAAVWDALTGTHYPPPIAADLLGAGAWRDPRASSQQVTAKLLEQFPTGSDGRRLRAVLKKQAFTFESDGIILPKSARYDWGSVVCRHILSIDRDTDSDDRITRISSRYGRICL